MNKKIAAMLVCFGFVASAGAEVNFDQGTGSKSAIDLTQKDIHHPGPIYPVPMPHHMSWSRDCHTFTFGSGLGATSERVYLNSTEWVEECHYVPDPPPHHPPHPGPNPHPNPPHHKSIGTAMDSIDSKGMQCHQRPGQVIRRTAQLTIGQRNLMPWETERFEVCLEGWNMDLRIRQQAYTYNVNQNGEYDVSYQLIPGAKLPTSPDSNGLSNGGFSVANDRFNLQINDQWASYYAGEKVAVRVELYKDGFWFFDSYKGKKEFTFDAAQGYQINFAENELDTSKSFSADFDPSKTFETGEMTKGGKSKYYVKWSFRRVGSISTSEWVEKGKTDKIEK